jgi:cyclic beta-1,2-glucan synthetase
MGEGKESETNFGAAEPLRAAVLTNEALHDLAASLADGDTSYLDGKSSRALRTRFLSNVSLLEKAYQILAEGAKRGESLSPGAEWLLDNHHIVLQHISEVRRFFPKRYDKTLPKIAEGASRGYPRVYTLTLQVLIHSDAVVDTEILSAFISGFQSRKPLTSGELWAVPIMLKFALVENLRRLIQRIVDEREELLYVDGFLQRVTSSTESTTPHVGTDTLIELAKEIKSRPSLAGRGAVHVLKQLRLRGSRTPLALKWFEERIREQGNDPEELIRAEHQRQAFDQISIANSITSMREMSSINWREWFEAMSFVHREFLSDPVGVYSKCDFETRDLYRHHLELLARRVKMAEHEAARLLVELAKQPPLIDPRRTDSLSHIGFYLIGDGRRFFEEKIQFSAPLWLRAGRLARQNALPLYTGAVLVGAVIFASFLSGWVFAFGGGFLAALLLFIVALIPASDLSMSLIQWICHQLVRPAPLPKLHLENGISEQNRALLIVHGIFDSTDALDHCIDSLEVRWYANEDEDLYLAITADLPDRKSPDESQDAHLIAEGKSRIDALNARHGYSAENPRFFIFFRERRWNDSELSYMGWERKRGKIDELNREICGKGPTSFLLSEKERSFLRTIRYVITLDGDSHLAPQGAKKLVGTMAHPLNRAIIDPVRRIVTSGYGIIQPRVSYSLPSGSASRFARIYAWDLGLDPYTHAISDFYQDIFSEASFLGKGIYDVAIFEEVLEDQVPENAILSHDLFEGLFARTGLATDIEVYDEVPSRYHVLARRQHRWVRGDWQLLPWLSAKVPDSDRTPRPTPLSDLGRWKIVDNLRRSLVPPTVFLFLLASWTILPGAPFWWFLAILPVFIFPVFISLASVAIAPPVGISLGAYLRAILRDLSQQGAQAALAVVFLPHQAYLMVHAIAVTLNRLYRTKIKLLEWETAAASERRLGSSLASFARSLAPALRLTVAVGSLVAFVAPERFFDILPLLALWMSSPIIATYLAKRSENAAADLTPEDRSYLLSVGYQTWRYFKDHLRAEYHYLIPDNLQQTPQEVVAERTSPTNISLSMLSSIAAYELGYEDSRSIITLLGRVFETIAKLERYNGHLLNWYDIRTLAPLNPRYVSSVDSGNFAGHLIAIRSSLDALWEEPVVRSSFIHHLIARLSALSESERRGESLITDLQHSLENHTHHTVITIATLGSIVAELSAILTAGSAEDVAWLFTELAELEQFMAYRELLEWSNLLVREIVEGEISATQSLNTKLSTTPASFAAISKIVEEIIATNNVGEITNAAQRARTLVAEIAESVRLTKQSCTDIFEQLDFSFLYDGGKNLFVVGLNVEMARKDRSFYDLLASEARLLSMIAIAKGDAPMKHWFSLGRTLADTPSGKALVSWSGTMFEYLMPIVVQRDYPETLLGQTYRRVIDTQQEYAHRRGVPWGISESAYSGVDLQATYQYRAFGVPGLGLKRGLENDLVISPYSTVLALPIKPLAAVANLRRMEKEGFRGDYGFFEAIDYTEDRLADDESNHIVKSFFAHHQGMSLPSIANVLLDGVFQDRFHSDPIIKAVEVLLHEKFPSRIPLTEPRPSPLTYAEREQEREGARKERIFSSPLTRYPATHILSNGSLTTMVDNTGSGFISFERDISVTRWREDITANRWGYYLYLRDLDTGELWSATYNPTQVEPELYSVVCKGDKVEFLRRDHQILSFFEITVAQEDNVDVRRITLTNLSDRKRNLEVTSFGEVALVNTRADKAHPAFQRLFVESSFDEEHDALIFSRRPRSRHDSNLFLFHSVATRTVWDRLQYETSRPNFIGRGNSLGRPAALKVQQLTNTVGSVLDPAFSLRVRIELEPAESHSLSFATGTARSRETLHHLTTKYRDLHSITRAFELAWSQSRIELRNEQFTARQTHFFQALGTAIFFPIEELRGSAENIQRNKLQQSALWRFGISGDIPILLLKVHDVGHLKLARDLVLGHAYLRARGITADLVILNEYPGGYFQELQEELLHIVRSSPDSGMLDHNGGIYIRVAAQLSSEEIGLLHTVARAVFDGADGSLEEQLNIDHLFGVLPSTGRGIAADPKLVQINAAPFNALSANTLQQERQALECSSCYGGFVEEGRGYLMEVDAQTKPPLPWSNVIANRRFGSLITESGGGYTWSQNSRENRISPWSNDPVIDPIGEAIYIRDTESGQVWCPTPGPIERTTKTTVIHRLGESSFSTSHNGISSDLTIRVAADAPVKWWSLTLKNYDSVQRRFEAYLFVDWVMGISPEEANRYVCSEYDPGAQVLYAVNRYNNEFANKIIYLGSNLSIISYTTDKVEFIGRDGSPALPRCFEMAAPARAGGGRTPRRNLVQLAQRVGAGFSSCGVIKVHINLEPGEERSALFFLGECDSPEALRTTAPQYRQTEGFNRDREQSQQWWNTTLSAIEVRTPDRSFDILVNGWLLYQNVACRLYARTGFYQSGGAFGFRDQLQDVLALLAIRPEMVRSQILLHAARQFVEGDVQHWWHPPTGRGVRTKISDDLVWLPYVVARYISDTGDTAILDEEINYLESPPLGEADESYLIPSVSGERGTLFDHCMRALDRAYRLGERGLPLMGAGDWNDGMNEVGTKGRGESVWLGWFLAHTNTLFAKETEDRAEEYAAELRLRARRLVEAIEQSSWDGAWYRRAYFDDGTALGSSANDECQIDSLSQSWSVIVGTGDSERAKKALRSVDARLVDSSARIIKLLSPPFFEGSAEPGFIKGYLRGIRENGGQYTHAATWVVIAHAMLGHGSRAFELFQMLNPITHSMGTEGANRYQGEPYVLCGDVYGVAPHEGRAGWSWYTGSAGWLYQAAVHHILGISLKRGVLSVNPSIPAQWREWSVTLSRPRPVTITFYNPDGVESGVKEIRVNGDVISERAIKLETYSGEIAIQVFLG